MITSAKEYLYRLQDIRNANLHTEPLLIPSDELVYEVDLNARTVDAPVFLSTETDHIAETVFFKVDRYFETHDLAKSTCIIQYINAKGEGYVYLVPVYDITTYANEEKPKILIPWVIQGNATAAAGTIKYALRFYNINKIERPEGTDTGTEYEIEYIINTQIAQSKILNGMGEKYLNDVEGQLEEVAPLNVWQELLDELTQILADENHSLQLYWTVLEH